MNEPLTLVWIDARGATILHLRDSVMSSEEILSDVPPHRRATVRVRHDPGIRHGGGVRQDAAEAVREEHLGTFVAAVAGRIPPDAAVLILGSGPVRLRLARRLRGGHPHGPHSRTIASQAAPRLTRRQLVERLLRAAGHEPRRRTIGAYRWSGLEHEPATGPVVPRRIGPRQPEQGPAEAEPMERSR